MDIRNKLVDDSDLLYFALEETNDGWWDWNVKEDTFYLSPKYWKNFGYDPSTKNHLFSEVQEVCHPDDLKKVQEMLQRHFESKGEIPYYTEVRYKHVDGHWAIVICQGRTVEWDEEGRPVRFIGLHTDITKRKNNELALKSANERFELAISGARAGIWEWDIGTNTNIWSEKFYNLLGYKVDEIEVSYEEWESRLHPDDKGTVLERLENHLKTDAPYEAEFRLRCKGGEYRWFEVSGQALRDKCGNPIKMAGSLEDINERKEAEQALKESKEQYNLAIQGVGVGIWDWLEVGTDSLFWSNRLKEILGFNPDELTVDLGTFLDRLHPEDKDRVWSAVDKHLTHQEKYNVEFRMRCKDGSYKWLRDTGQARFDESGKPTRMVGSVEDIQARKDVEIQLKESLSLLDSINENAGLAFISTDAKGSVLAFNRAAEELLGYDSEEVIGKLDPSSWHDPNEVRARSEEFSEKLNRKIEPGFETFVCFSNEGINNQYEWIFIHKNGSRIPVLLTISQLLSPEGELIGYLGIAQDITTQKEQELEIVTQTKVAHQNAKLVSIGELAAGVGHEINNPLAIIKGYVNSIKIENEKSGGIKDKYLLSTMDKIDIATNRISKITSGLRSFSRMDDDEISAFSPVEILEESCNLLAEIYEKEYGINLTLNLDSTSLDNTLVSGHRGRLQQVLMNLLSNAKDVLEDSEVKNITVTCTREGEKLKINVEDSGSGIPNDVKDRIFDPFFTTKDVNEGTGIGLSLVHRFITEMNGEIELDTSINKGSIFKIKLPCQVDNAGTSNYVKKDGSKTKVSTDRKMSILVADDEEDLRELLSELLEYFGHEVKTVENGELALNAYLNDPDKYDIIISDMVMPKMDGPALLRSLRSNKSIAQPGFIFFTGGINNNFESRDNELYGLFDAYFLKPFDLDTIQEAIDICVEKMDGDKD